MGLPEQGHPLDWAICTNTDQLGHGDVLDSPRFLLRFTHNRNVPCPVQTRLRDGRHLAGRDAMADEYSDFEVLMDWSDIESAIRELASARHPRALELTNSIKLAEAAKVAGWQEPSS